MRAATILVLVVMTLGLVTLTPAVAAQEFCLLDRSYCAELPPCDPLMLFPDGPGNWLVHCARG